MASTIPNERLLRQITIAAVFPALPIIIASGIMSEKSVRDNWGWVQDMPPTIIFFGLIPTFLSAISSIVAIRTKHDPLEKRPLWVTRIWCLIDLFLTLANLAVLIAVWIEEPYRMWRHADRMMLETYATMFLLINMCIHAYLAFYPVRSLFPFEFQGECPHCHGKLGTHAETVGNKREGYSLLRGQADCDDDAEPSTGVIRLSTDSEA